MAETARSEEDTISVIGMVTTLLRNRWRIGRWMFAGFSAAAILVFLQPALYIASASFAPQGNEASRAGLASLAGQFGLSIPAGNQSLSPEFYSSLLKSRVLFQQIARDTLVVSELGRQRISVLDLFKIGDGPQARREEQAVARLGGLVETSVVRSTGVVQLSVATEWPSVSLSIVTALVNGVNEFNQRTRQGQATSERKFVEGRLVVASAGLRAAEDRLQGFLQSNREFARSPELSFQRDRLQRDVVLQQQVFTSLTQSLEEARLREVRDTPVITVIEPPAVATTPRSRKRLVRLLLGLILGGLFGSGVVFASEAVARRRKRGDSEVEELVWTIGEAKGEMLGRARFLKGRVRE